MDIKKVKINDLLESQIPEFLNEESPLFKEFLKSYFLSLETKSGSIDIVKNLPSYKNIDNFTYESLNPGTTLTSSVLSFDNTINVVSTNGFPEKFGLIKIDNEIITYKSKTKTSFIDCFRGFSGIDSLKSLDNSQFLVFNKTSSNEHQTESIVYNLSNLFIQEFFTKFKSQFLPGFESRNFITGISIQNILSKAKDFYISKGTDTSYKILFKILYGEDIDLIKPQDYTLVPSSNLYFITKNMLVERTSDQGFDPSFVKGNFLFQPISGVGTASASIFNVEYRPINGRDFYEISLDSTSFSGNFQVTGKTKIMEETPIGATSILVDSTLGFSKSGKVLIKPKNSNFIEVTYTDTSINQFLGVSGVTKKLDFGLDVVENKFAFAYVGLGQTTKVEFRIVNVINDVDFSKTSNLRVNDIVSLSGFGRDLSSNFRFNTWIYNLPTNHNVKDITQQDLTKYRINLYDEISFFNGEDIKIQDKFGKISNAKIIAVEFATGDVIKKYSSRILVQVLNPTSSVIDTTIVKKIIIKSKHNTNYFSNISDIPCGIQNTYIDFDNTSLYVTTSGLPLNEIFAEDTKKFVYVSGSGSTPQEIITSIKHGYSTGDQIYYSTTNLNSGVPSGYYFLTKIDTNSFKISYSKNDVFFKKYLKLNPGNYNNFIIRGGYENKTLKNQKKLKKFNISERTLTFDDKNKRSTNNREIGLFNNGVEILSPTLFDENIYFGKLNIVKVTNSGKNYDIIDTPEMQVFDVQGSGAKIYANILGKVKDIKVITAGIGYQEKPKISIVGGNGKGCILESNLVKSKINVGFRPSTDINPAADTITFAKNHNFDDAEEVLYNSNGNADVPGLIDKSHYYVGVTSTNQIKLFNTFQDAVSKSNTINITGVSSGFHNITTVKSKNTITKVYVKDSGSGYSNRSVKIPSKNSDGKIIGINTFDSYLIAFSHGFSTGEIVRYSSTHTSISGLSSSADYIIKVLDKNSFKLALAGVGTTVVDQNLLDAKFVKFGTIGVGTHTISYPPIEIKVETLAAIASTSITKPILKPVVLGEITDVYIEQGGISYGCTNIVNYHRRPEVGFSSIQSLCLLQPIILNGIINDVKIINKGRGYRKDSYIEIFGNGEFAQLEPIITEGRVTGINIINGGVGYASSNTQLTISNRGVGAKFLADVYEWKINQPIKSKDFISIDDQGMMYPSRDPRLGLEYIHFYAPNNLRYQLEDNFTISGKEKTSGISHSPILGYAYDGNPIYGPYGYDPAAGGSIRKINSSYELVADLTSGNRPPGYDPGYFINDYLYTGFGDLDEFNGRFCLTPQYPNGTYAYFINITVDSNAKSTPAYPYIVGEYFKDIPIEENFLPSFTQDIDFTKLQISRNVGPYYLTKNNSFYDLIDKVSDNFKQEIRVREVQSSGITSISIFSQGSNYRVGDKLNIQSFDGEGSGASVIVSELEGKTISNFSIISDNGLVSFDVKGKNVTAKTTYPHQLLDGENVVISGVSTQTHSSLEVNTSIQVSTKSVELSKDVPSTATTGISTFIIVKDITGFETNDLIGIGTEILRITQIFPEKSAFYVNRLENVGVHSAGNTVFLLPTKFTFVGNEPKLSTPPNEIVFFDPKETVGVGTAGVTRSLVGIGTSSVETRFIPAKSIYLPGHKFFTGQPLVYGAGFGGTSLYVTNNFSGIGSFTLNNGQIVYAVNFSPDYIGISTVGYTTTSGIGTNLNSVYFLDFISYSTIGFAHSLSTINSTVTGSYDRYVGVITTSSDHQLIDGDVVKVIVNDAKERNIDVYYNPEIRKLVTNKKTFSFTGVSTVTSTIDVGTYPIKTGDKIVYRSVSPISGLTDNGVYFVIKNDKTKISLCDNYSDIDKNKKIIFGSGGGASQELYLINPPIEVVESSKIKFNLSDSSLSEMEFIFYEDADYNKRIEIVGSGSEGFILTRKKNAGQTEAEVILNTGNSKFRGPLYYNLIPKSPIDVRKTEISSDNEVVGRNKISIKKHILENTFQVNAVTSKVFTLNLTKKPDSLELSEYNVANLHYTTTSTTSHGPINKLRVNFKGRGYKKIPAVTKIFTEKGKDAIIKFSSSEIGKVENFDRVKDGFDYPTDPTLSPSLSVPTVISIKDIRTIDYIGIVTGGKNYNVAPVLIVKDHPYINLKATIQGGSISKVNIVDNVNDLKAPLEITPIYNSNGYAIDFITVNGNLVTLELSNSINENPLINIGYGSTIIKYPFKVGDEIFIENCRLTPNTNGKANFNSSKYNYKFFPVVGINSSNNTVTYSMSGISTGQFGTYDDEKTLGTVINKKDMPVFEMILKDDSKYFSKEKVTAQNFSAIVMENGWDNDLNQLRVNKSFGELNIGDKLFGDVSKIKGVVETFDTFQLNATLGVTREKIGQIDNSVGILNDFQQRISDNFYYQKFSYSIKGQIPYNIWKEAVRSIIHPSGFKEFSDLVILTKPSLSSVQIGIAASTNLKPKVAQNVSSFRINLDKVVDTNEKNHFALVYEDDILDDGSVERVFFSEGSVALRRFILNKTNKVLKIDDISSQFNGTSIQKLDGTFADASDLLEANRSFIQEEVVGFITATYPGITTSPGWNRTVCARDVGLVVDAISHDVKYKSNNKTVAAGLSYWSPTGTNYVYGESTQTIAGFKYIAQISKFIINNVGVQTSYQLGTTFSISNSSYNNITGIQTIGINTSITNLNVKVGDWVVLKNLVFSCNSGGGIQTATFPALGAGPDGNPPLSPKGFTYQIVGLGSTTLTINPGISTIPHTYVSGGTVQKAFITTSQYINNSILQDKSCNINYNQNCCANVQAAIETYVGIITTIIGIGTTAAPNILNPDLARGGSIVGFSSFKLKNKSFPLFKREFSGFSTSVISLIDNKFTLVNHNFQTGQELSYDYGSGSPIGIATTSYVLGVKTVLMGIGTANGTAILQNGYNIDVGTVTGISTILSPVGPTTKYSLDAIGIGSISGTGAIVDVLITYSGATGQPLSTSISLKSGGKNFIVGETVSIAGTFMGGTNPTNNLTFVVTKTGPTAISTQSNITYSDVFSTDTLSQFTVVRNSVGRVDSITLLKGGSGYATTSIVSIAGTYIGGINPSDTISFLPSELGTNVIPKNVFVYKIDDNNFKISGFSTSIFFDLQSLGTGTTHSFSYIDPNPSTIISIDGVVQTSLRRKSLSVSLGSSVSSASTTLISISSGISSLNSNDIININNEYIKVKNIGVAGTGILEVERSFLGTISGVHTVGASATVLTGDYNIVGDTLYFTTPPYGKIGPVGLQTGSIFAGRVFSRKFDSTQQKDKNIILDDISLSFTGIAATQFTVKTNGQTTQALYNDVNFGSEINNNPLIFINNVSQESGVDFTIDGPGSNIIKFLTGTPSAGKISKVDIINSGFGYIVPRVATANAVISAAGTISSLTLTGIGSAYRSVPSVSIASTVGFGASVTAIVGAGGTITGFTIINPGSGYTSSFLPTVVIGIPTGYSNLGIAYTNGTSGVGQRAKVSVVVGENSDIISFKIDNPGVGYKVGDVLKIPNLLSKSSGFRTDIINISNLSYDTVSGVTTITTSTNHGLKQNDQVRLSGIAFTCGYDEIGIKTFSYDHVTGISTIVTYSPHGLLNYNLPSNKTAKEVFLHNLPFACAAQHAGVTTTIFPDGTGIYGKVFPVLTSLGSTSFTINSGISTIPHIFVGWPEIGITTFKYTNTTGIATVTTSSNHSFVVGNKVTFFGLEFNCPSGSGITSTIFPYSGSSPSGFTFTVLGINNANEFVFNVGISTIVHSYVSGGYTKKVPTMQGVIRYPNESRNGAYDFTVTGIKTTNIFTIQAGLTTIPHYYTQSGIVSFRQFEEFKIRINEVQTDKFSGSYPGQFIKFDDISSNFNEIRRKFTLTITTSGQKDIVSLKIIPGSDLDITNNIFVYINDILQNPGDAYTFFGSRISFKEPPKKNSKCSIYYYRGSSLDVQDVEPPKTIKEGDTIQIKENKNDILDTDQFERVVKKIVSSDQLDTFTYKSFGIDVNPLKIRPLTWKKQRQDRIIGGTLFAKSRPSLIANLRPNAIVIKEIGLTDNEIYVDNAFPIFSNVDALDENLRNLLITETRTVNVAMATCIVSSSSTISSVAITTSGVGYAYTTNPAVIISKSRITRKDPIENWQGIIGVSSSYTLNSIDHGNIFVGVGSNSIYAISNDGYNWNTGLVGYAGTIGFNAIACGSTNNFVAVGEYGKVVRSIGYGTTIGSWSELSLLEEAVTPGLNLVIKVGSSYTSTFNAIHYSPVFNTWTAVGVAGSIFGGVGIGTTQLISRFSQSLSNINSVTSTNTRIYAVGNGGLIISSLNNVVWETLSPPSIQNLRKIINVNGTLVIVGDQGVIIKSVSAVDFISVNNNLNGLDLRDVYYDSDLYIVITSSGSLYYSFDLSNWILRPTKQNKILKNIISEPSVGLEGKIVSVGVGTVITSEPIFNQAKAISYVSSGVVTSIQIINGGFGYSQLNPPPLLVETDYAKTENILSFKALGDFGSIIGITTYVAGTGGIGTTSPKIDFTLKSDTYDNSTLGIGYSSLNSYGVNYSQLSKGDYFVITNSNVTVGHALTGITTFLGGMSNYPASKVGTASSFIDGVYRVENVTTQSLGIVTVTCHFAPIEGGFGNFVSVYVRGSNNTGVGTNGFYGRYSWGKIYDYQNRVLLDPQTFKVYNDNGIIGISTNPQIFRTRGL